MPEGYSPLKIKAVTVSNLLKSIVASGIPMQTTKGTTNSIENDCVIASYLHFVDPGSTMEELTERVTTLSGGAISTEDMALLGRTYNRFSGLSSCGTASGELSFLKGVVVNCNIVADHSFWMQWQRYHFQEITSQQSKQHRLLKLSLDEYKNIKEIDHVIVDRLELLIALYNGGFGPGSNCDENTVTHICNTYTDETNTYTKQELFMLIIRSCFIGLQLEANVSLSYLQIITMYKQREHHKMEEWSLFRKWAERLPLMKHILIAQGLLGVAED